METKINFFEKFWYIFVIIALILIAVVTTLWFNNQKSLKNKQNQVIQPPVETMIQPTLTLVPGDTATVNLETQSDSDEISSIENDIKATNLTDLNKEMATIEAELSNPE
jgi:hypothetical protein